MVLLQCEPHAVADVYVSTSYVFVGDSKDDIKEILLLGLGHHNFLSVLLPSTIIGLIFLRIEVQAWFHMSYRGHFREKTCNHC